MLRHRKKGGGSVCFRNRRGEPGLSLRSNERADVSPPIQAGGGMAPRQSVGNLCRGLRVTNAVTGHLWRPLTPHRAPLDGPIMGGDVSPGHLCSHAPAGCQPPSTPLASLDTADFAASRRGEGHLWRSVIPTPKRILVNRKDTTALPSAPIFFPPNHRWYRRRSRGFRQ